VRRAVVAVAAAVAVAGCGGGDADRDVADRWVEAVDAEQWKRACDLSVGPRRICVEALREAFAGVDDLRLRQAGGNFVVRGDRGEGVPFRVEDRGGEKLVHFEVQIIR
jgi:hypothetical protein